MQYESDILLYNVFLRPPVDGSNALNASAHTPPLLSAPHQRSARVPLCRHVLRPLSACVVRRYRVWDLRIIVNLRWKKQAHGGDYIHVADLEHYYPPPDASSDPDDVEGPCIT